MAREKATVWIVEESWDGGPWEPVDIYCYTARDPARRKSKAMNTPRNKHRYRVAKYVREGR